MMKGRLESWSSITNSCSESPGVRMALSFEKELNTEFLAQNVHLLLFRLGKQTYALPIEHVVQIIPMLSLTPVPQLKQIVEGVANIHGEVVPVLNARRFLGMPDLPLELDTPIILCKIQQHSLGLIVDEVLDVLTVLDNQITATQRVLPDGLNTTHSINGIIYQADRSILLLNPQFLLNPNQLRTINQVMDSLPPVQVAELPEAEEFEDLEIEAPAAAFEPFVPPAPADESTPEVLDQEAVASVITSLPELPADDALPNWEPVVAEAVTPVEAALVEAASPTELQTPESSELSSVPEPSTAPETPSKPAKKSRARKKRPDIFTEQFASLAANLPPTNGSAADGEQDNNNNHSEGGA